MFGGGNPTVVVRTPPPPTARGPRRPRPTDLLTQLPSLPTTKRTITYLGSQLHCYNCNLAGIYEATLAGTYSLLKLQFFFLISRFNIKKCYKKHIVSCKGLCQVVTLYYDIKEN